MVITKQREAETPMICVVTRGGVHTGGDASTLGANKQPWVHKEVDPLPKFDLGKEKQT